MSKIELGTEEGNIWDQLSELYQILINDALNDVNIIDQATTLIELKPVLSNINDRQIKIMKAIKALKKSIG